jgi:hypothetical protein
LNGIAIKVINEAATEAEGKVGREIDVSGASFGEIGIEEMSKIGPPRR